MLARRYGSLLALEHRDRIRHLRLFLPERDLQKFVMAIDEEFQYLIVDPWAKDSASIDAPGNTSSTKSTSPRADLPVQYDLDYTRPQRALSRSIL